jgi:polysaccharide export outer membrane protein
MPAKGKRQLRIPCILLSAFVFMPINLSAQRGAWVNANVNQGTANTQRHRQAVSTGTLTAVPEDFSKLQLAPGFLLAFSVYDAPQMSMNLRIDDSGDVTIPTAGAIHIGGQTVAEAQQTITKILQSKGLFVNPQVSLSVLQYTARYINVMGQVQMPGRIEILTAKPLSDVLALAGGETEAAGSDIEIRSFRNGKQFIQNVHYIHGQSKESLRNVLVQPGSSVYVRKVGTIYVLGSVLRPGGYEMVNGGNLNVAQALALAEGTVPQAAVRSIRIVRQNSNGTITQIHVPYKKITNGKVRPMMLEANDVVYVPSSKLKSILLSGTGILASTAGAATYVMAP